MLKTTKWMPEKNKIKAVFRLQFHATHIPRVGWDKLYVSFIPAESGKVTGQTKKAIVRNGSCKWADPIYETTRLLQDSKTKKCEDKIYKLVVAMGMSRSGVLGEAEVNIAEFYGASKPVVIALPLHECGSVLHVTLQLLTSKTGFRDFEEQSELREMSFVKSSCSSSSSDDPSPIHTSKENTEVEEYSESELRSNGSNSSPQTLHPEHEVSTPNNNTDVVVNSLERSLENIENTTHSFEKHGSASNAQPDLEFLEISKKMPCFFSSVEDGLRDLHKKALFADDASFCPDIDSVLETLRDLKLGFEKEQRTLESRIHDLETRVEYFVHETGEIQMKMAVESRSLRHEYSTCIYTVSTAKSEVEDTNRRLLGLLEEREELISTNGELERRAVRSEDALRTVRERYSVSVGRLQSDLELLSLQISSMFENSCFSRPDNGYLNPREDSCLGEKIENLEHEILELKEENINLSTRSDLEIHELVKEKAECFLEVDRLGSKIEKLEEEILRLKEENKSSRIISDLEIHEAGEENTRLFLEIGRLNSRTVQLEEESLRSKEENASLRKKSDFQTLEIARLGSQIERLEEDNTSLTIRLDSEILEIGRLVSEIEKLRFKIGECRQLEETVEVKTVEAAASAIVLEIVTDKMRLLRNEDSRSENLISRNIILEVRDIVLEAELSERNLKAEELRRISRIGNETLRIALMKEEYESRIEDLEQRLIDSRKHGGEILLKLQDAAEEVEKRKKTEILLKAESSSRRLEICEEEKKNLEILLKECRDELQRLRGTPDTGGKEKAENEFGKIIYFKSAIDRLHSQLEMLIRENHGADIVPTMVLEEENEEVDPAEIASGDVLLENEVGPTRMEERGVKIEKELIEMQQRYSKLSLMFAQVEGERQRLLFILKNNYLSY